MPKKKMGAPTKLNAAQIEQLKKLASIFCSMEEIASIAGVSKSALEKNKTYYAAIKEGREHGRCSLRKKQFEVALGGNVGMLIWLGKQYLEQSDKLEQKSEVTEKRAPQPVVFKLAWGDEVGGTVVGEQRSAEAPASDATTAAH